MDGWMEGGREGLREGGSKLAEARWARAYHCDIKCVVRV